MVKLNDIRKKYKHQYPLSDIDVLIMHILKIDKSKLYLNPDISSEDARKIQSALKRLENGEPVAYITGTREFMSLDFNVNSSTLIPRPDTEILVEELISRFKGKFPVIFEIGTGSGCIAVSLAKYLPNSKIYACDISRTALKTARLNAKNHGVSERIDFFYCDILKNFPSFPEKLDVIVSNPPYIESSVIKTLDKSVREFEPFSALCGGDDGLLFYRRITDAENLSLGGVLAFEIGYNQGSAVSSIMAEKFNPIHILKDLSGNDRVVIGTKKL